MISDTVLLVVLNAGIVLFGLIGVMLMLRIDSLVEIQEKAAISRANLWDVCHTLTSKLEIHAPEWKTDAYENCVRDLVLYRAYSIFPRKAQFLNYLLTNNLYDNPAAIEAVCLRDATFSALWTRYGAAYIELYKEVREEFSMHDLDEILLALRWPTYFLTRGITPKACFFDFFANEPFIRRHLLSRDEDVVMETIRKWGPIAMMLNSNMRCVLNRHPVAHPNEAKFMVEVAKVGDYSPFKRSMVLETLYPHPKAPSRTYATLVLEDDLLAMDEYETEEATDLEIPEFPEQEPEYDPLYTPMRKIRPRRAASPDNVKKLREKTRARRASRQRRRSANARRRLCL